MVDLLPQSLSGPVLDETGKLERAAYLLYCDMLLEKCGCDSNEQIRRASDYLIKSLKEAVDDFRR